MVFFSVSLLSLIDLEPRTTRRTSGKVRPIVLFLLVRPSSFENVNLVCFLYTFGVLWFSIFFFTIEKA